MNEFSNVTKAIETLKLGGLIILADDETREAEGDMVGLASKVTTESVNRMITSARGLLCVPVAPEIASKLELEQMTTDHDAFGTAFAVSMDHKSTSTGISAEDRAKTIRNIADPDSKKNDFYHPGHVFPLIGRKNGLLQRRGHTEAAIELARLTENYPVAYICEIIKKNGLMARRNELKSLAEGLEIPFLTIEELTEYLIQTGKRKITSTPIVNLPTKYGNFKMTGFEFTNKEKMPVVLQKGKIDSDEPVLVRLHSECLTGDAFGSMRCECGEQLHKSMQMIDSVGKGVILYLRQEGRGIGLFDKISAYDLQDKGFDTYDANIELGHKPDERSYEEAGLILRQLGIKKIKLITNNPDKINQLDKLGIEVVERIPLEIETNGIDTKYLETKRDKFHHYLKLGEE